MNVEGKILNGLFHVNILEQAFLSTTNGPASTLVDLKQMMNLGCKISEQS